MLQFANGTFTEAVSRVDTTWTFVSGLKVPIMFEVLKKRCAIVIPCFCSSHSVFLCDSVFPSKPNVAPAQGKSHEDEDRILPLVPFSYEIIQQRDANDLKSKLSLMSNIIEQHETQERERCGDYGPHSHQGRAFCKSEFFMCCL